MQINELIQKKPEIQTLLSRSGAVHQAKTYGFLPVGQGGYGTVLGHPNLNYVLKIFDTTDGYYEFVKFAMQNQDNPYFPRFRGKVIKLIDAYAIRMERLEGFVKRNVVDAIASYFYTDQIDYDTRDVFIRFPKLKNAIDLISHLRDKFHLDIYESNIMTRYSDQSVVITDPYGGRKYDR